MSNIKNIDIEKENTMNTVSKKLQDDSEMTCNKKAILGEKTQEKVMEDETPTSPLGAALIKRKRENQGKRQCENKEPFNFTILPC